MICLLLYANQPEFILYPFFQFVGVLWYFIIADFCVYLRGT